MTHIIRCPHCKKELFRYTTFGRVSVASLEKKYGSPYLSCTHCGKQCVDKSRREIALPGGLQKKDSKRFSWIGIVCAISAMFMLFSLIIFAVDSEENPFSDGGGYMLLAIAALFLIPGIIEFANYQKRVAELQRLGRESAERLRNPNYAAALKELGYNVPDSHLNSASGTQNTSSQAANATASSTSKGSASASASPDDVIWAAPSFTSPQSNTGASSVKQSQHVRSGKQQPCPCCGAQVDIGLESCPYCETVLNTR